MSYRSSLAAIGVALLLSLGACASPNPSLYTVSPQPGPVLSGAPKVVILRELTLAGYLDRRQIVRSSENFRLDVAANDLWGESVSAMLSRVLVDELGQRLPASSVYSENDAMSVTPDATVELSIRRMDADASGNVVLAAQAVVVISRHHGAPITRSFRIVAPQPNPTVQGEVTAISAAVGQLADGLATMLQR